MNQFAYCWNAASFAYIKASENAHSPWCSLQFNKRFYFPERNLSFLPASVFDLLMGFPCHTLPPIMYFQIKYHHFYFLQASLLATCFPTVVICIHACIFYSSKIFYCSFERTYWPACLFSIPLREFASHSLSLCWIWKLKIVSATFPVFWMEKCCFLESRVHIWLVKI